MINQYPGFIFSNSYFTTKDTKSTKARGAVPRATYYKIFPSWPSCPSWWKKSKWEDSPVNRR